MGLLRTVLSALLGPVLIYFLLMGHTFHRMLLQEPEPLTVQDFPKGTTQAARDAVVAGRKELLADAMDAFAGKARKDFVEKWCTEDIEFEDYLTRWKVGGARSMIYLLGTVTVHCTYCYILYVQVSCHRHTMKTPIRNLNCRKISTFFSSQGTEEFGNLLSAASRIVKDLSYDVHGEHHGPHEIVMDWTMTFTTTYLPSYPMSLRMRSRILLEPPSRAGGQERIFRIYEEWNGNKQLNEKTTFGPLGRVHQRLRRFTGYLAASAVTKGYL